MGGILDFRTESTSNTYNTSYSWRDSNNQSASSTNALENVGSLNITLPQGLTLATIAPWVMIAGVAMLALALFRRR